MQSLTGFRAIVRDQRGAVLAAALVIMVLLMGIAAIGSYSGYTNLLTSTNLRLATKARATAETNIDEAVYRLSLPPGTNGVITPDLSTPNWSIGIAFSSTPGSGKVASIQASGDWPATAYQAGSTTTLQYKKDANGNVIFYNRAISTSPPFLKVTLPDVLGLHLVDPLATLLDQVYDRLCAVNLPSIGVGGLVGLAAINPGGVLGLCPPNTNLADLGYPVIQIRGAGVDARGAEREFLAEAVRTVQFTPLAPLAAGGTVNLNSTGFIDGVNHNPNIVLTAAAGAAAIYGDEDAETTEGLSGLVTLVKDSPDDNALWLSLAGGLLGIQKYSIANVSLLLKVPLLFYTSFPRIYNRQISATDTTSAWIDVDPLYRALNAITVTGTGLGNILVPIANLGIWEGVNSGYRAPIALSATGTVQNAPIPPGQPVFIPLTGLPNLLVNGVNSNPLVWRQGVFTWRNNNKNDGTYFKGSSNLTTTLPPVNTVRECGPAIQGGPGWLTCRPAALANLPSLQFQKYLGLDNTAFQDLLSNADTDKTALSANQPPLGFTYINGNYTLKSTTLSPGTSQFGLIYATENLDIQGNHTFKGLIFVDGNLTIQTGGSLTVLGAVMVRGNVTQTVGAPTGTMTLLYSREAANRGIQTSHPWRILSWVDTAVQDEAD